MRPTGLRYLPQPRVIRFLAVLIASITAISCGDAPDRSSSTDTDQPNIILILVDDLGLEWVSAYGAEDIETPAIDALASEGIRFENAYSMPQCTPTRVTVLTGQYPWRHGWTNHWDVPRWGAGVHFDPNHNLTFVRLLRDAGYATAIAGKWQINDFRVQPEVLRDHGFDDWAVWTGYESENPPSAERYWDPYIHTREGSRTYSDAFGPDVFVAYLEQFLSEHRDRPQFIYFPMVLTHPPLVPTPDEPEAMGMQPRHQAMVRYMDKTVGSLVHTVDSLELDDTYIIFTTDNGTSRGLFGTIDGRRIEGGKGSLFERGAHAPFIVRAPQAITGGRVVDVLSDFSDLFPTILDLAGISVLDTVKLDGVSIAPVIRGETSQSGREWTLTMGFGPGRLTDEGLRPVQLFTDRAVREGRYKLWIEDGVATRLFDLLEDPWEEVNLIDSAVPEHISAREKLQQVVDTFPSEDAWPRYDPTPAQVWDVEPEER